MRVFRVGAQSRPKSVADAIAAAIRADGGVELHSIGALATYTAVKAIIVANAYMSLVTVPSFTKIETDGHDENLTAVAFIVKAVG